MTSLLLLRSRKPSSLNVNYYDFQVQLNPQAIAKYQSVAVPNILNNSHIICDRDEVTESISSIAAFQVH
ncbi:MAG: hypothetical protein HC941_31610 [Microcoleus sp. SU_5_3]|nr:hypothetical protein [Microcoleus sp. SU_5_3]